MELISLKAACDAISEEYDNYPYDERARGLLDAIGIITDEVPTIPAVPLDKLCEWMADNVYLKDDADGALELNSDNWKKLLTKWMEDQDANRP